MTDLDCFLSYSSQELSHCFRLVLKVYLFCLFVMKDATGRLFLYLWRAGHPLRWSWPLVVSQNDLSRVPDKQAIVCMVNTLQVVILNRLSYPVMFRMDITLKAH